MSKFWAAAAREARAGMVAGPEAAAAAAAAAAEAALAAAVELWSSTQALHRTRSQWHSTHQPSAPTRCIAAFHCPRTQPPRPRTWLCAAGTGHRPWTRRKGRRYQQRQSSSEQPKGLYPELQHGQGSTDLGTRRRPRAWAAEAVAVVAAAAAATPWVGMPEAAGAVRGCTARNLHSWAIRTLWSIHRSSRSSSESTSWETPS